MNLRHYIEAALNADFAGAGYSETVECPNIDCGAEIPVHKVGGGCKLDPSLKAHWFQTLKGDNDTQCFKLGFFLSKPVFFFFCVSFAGRYYTGCGG